MVSKSRDLQLLTSNLFRFCVSSSTAFPKTDDGPKLGIKHSSSSGCKISDAKRCDCGDLHDAGRCTDVNALLEVICNASSLRLAVFYQEEAR